MGVADMGVLGMLRVATMVKIHQEIIEMKGPLERSLGKCDENLVQWCSWHVIPSNM